MKKKGMKAHSAHAAISNQPVWQFRLYIADSSARSMLAVANLQLFCERYLESRYRIRIIDIMEDPHIAIRDGIIATPALVCTGPKPCRMLIGCLSDFEAVARTLNVRTFSSASRLWPLNGVFVQGVGSA